MLSIIIPALNEAGNLQQLLTQLFHQTDIDAEIIVVDGGSADDTCEVVKSTGATLLTSAPGRGRQMNAGAAWANGDWLLFLHADSRLTADDQLSLALDFLGSQPDRTAGHFAMQFYTRDTAVRRALAFFEAKTELNRPGTWNGDQGLLIRQSDFMLLGGFSEAYPFLEDQDFGRRFIESGKFVTLPGMLLTSARRFRDEGITERITLNAIIMGMFSICHDAFFRSAPGIYREATVGQKLDPGPFVKLARQSIFDSGLLAGLVRCYRIGRYVAANAWQLALWRGVRTNNVRGSLERYDRYVAILVDNPVGGLLGTACVIIWFFCLQARLA